MIDRDTSLLRLFVNANEKFQGIPLYRAIVESVRRSHLAGASVFPVELGYGAHRLIHDQASEYASFAIPIVIEIVDATARVKALLDELGTMIREGLVVITPVDVYRYTHAAERDEDKAGTQSPDVAAQPETASSEKGSTAVKIEGVAKRMTVYVGSADTRNGRNLAVAIVERCRAMGMAGATVSRGIMGFGKHSIIHKAHLLGLSDDLPEKIEVIDRPEQIERLLPVLDGMIGGGLIVVEDVQVVRYGH
jgi:PII-like signaling protein